MRKASLLAALAALAISVVPTAPAREESKNVQKVSAAGAVHLAWLMERIEDRRNETWHWERVVHGKARTRYVASAKDSRSIDYRRWVLDLWRTRAAQARRKAHRPPHKAEWLCIHRYEGAWDDPNAPYYGGLQMDLTFQRSYGPELLRRKGTADNWTPLEQMWVAERAHRSGRGFYPWPNTARWCGLI